MDRIQFVGRDMLLYLHDSIVTTGTCGGCML